MLDGQCVRLTQERRHFTQKNFCKIRVIENTDRLPGRAHLGKEWRYFSLKEERQKEMWKSIRSSFENEWRETTISSVVFLNNMSCWSYLTTTFFKVGS